MTDPMERLGPWYFKDAAPEVELMVHEVGRAAMVATREFVNAWCKRPTAEWIDPAHDEAALFAVVDLERLRESSSPEIESLPFLPEAPPSWESGRTLIGELRELSGLLPFAEDEVADLRGGLAKWSRSDLGAWPKVSDPEVLATWQAWLREPPDTDGVRRVRKDALTTHVLCFRLREAARSALSGKNSSVY